MCWCEYVIVLDYVKSICVKLTCDL